MSKKKTKQKTRLSPLLVILVLIIISALTLYYFDIPPFDFDLGFGFKNRLLPLDRNGKLTMHFIDVGQGDCIFIELPDGKNMIIDGGDGTKAHNNAILNYLSGRRISTVDYLVLTHSDEDHVGGLITVINSDIDVLCAYIPYVASAHENDIVTNFPGVIPDALSEVGYLTVETAVYKNFIGAIISEGLTQGDVNEKIFINIEGLVIEGEYYSFKFLMPNPEIYEKKKNNAEYKNCVSPIMLLEYNNKKVMFTGDANDITEKIFADKYRYSFTNVSADVLKVGHHGSESSTTEEFLEIIKPGYAVICVGAGNSYMHPRQATLDRLTAINCVIYRTDLNGTVVLTINADGLYFTTLKEFSFAASFNFEIAYISKEQEIFYFVSKSN